MAWHKTAVIPLQMQWGYQWPVSVKRCHLTSIGIPIIKIRWSQNHLYNGNTHTCTRKKQSLYWVRAQSLVINHRILTSCEINPWETSTAMIPPEPSMMVSDTGLSSGSWTSSPVGVTPTGNVTTETCEMTKTKLKHCCLNKMADVLQMTFLNAFSSVNFLCILIQISMNYVPDGLIVDKTALVQNNGLVLLGITP